MREGEAGEEWKYCRSCKKNIQQKKNEHNYTKKHKDVLLWRLNATSEDIKAQKYFVKNINRKIERGDSFCILKDSELRRR